MTEEIRQTTTTLFIGNVPYHLRKEDILDIFGKSGPIKNVTMGIHPRTGESRGYAFVEYDRRVDAEDAMSRWKGQDLDGRRLRMDWDIGKEKKVDIGLIGRAEKPDRDKRTPSRSRSHSPPPLHQKDDKPPTRTPSPPPDNKEIMRDDLLQQHTGH